MAIFDLLISIIWYLCSFLFSLILLLLILAVALIVVVWLIKGIALLVDNEILIKKIDKFFTLILKITQERR